MVKENKVSPDSAGKNVSLYSRNGRRKYINEEERRRVIENAKRMEFGEYIFLLSLIFLGVRISEALALRGNDIQFEEGVISVRCLKKRGAVIIRELPAPPDLLEALLTLANERGDPEAKLWSWSRVSAWRIVKAVLEASDVHGDQAMPKGFRHGFGVHAIRRGVPLDLVQRWLGHADISTTAIYTQVMGPEERAIAARMW